MCNSHEAFQRGKEHVSENIYHITAAVPMCNSHEAFQRGKEHVSVNIYHSTAAGACNYNQPVHMSVLLTGAVN
jgi:hypothetical protein